MQLETGKAALLDKGGRRSGIERRCFSYTCYIPERRSGMDRRSGNDRRRSRRLNILTEVEVSQAPGLQVSRAPR
jgi:hypothetical protein